MLNGRNGTNCEYAYRESHRVDVEQQLSGQSEALVNVEGAGEVRVIDESLPPDGGTRLLEVHAHDDEELVLIVIDNCAQLGSWVQRERERERVETIVRGL